MLLLVAAVSAVSNPSSMSLRQEGEKTAVLANYEAEDFLIPPPTSPESAVLGMAFLEAYQAYLDTLGTHSIFKKRFLCCDQSVWFKYLLTFLNIFVLGEGHGLPTFANKLVGTWANFNAQKK